MVEGGTNPSLEMLRESLEYTPTWVVAAVCSIIVLISLLVERFLHYLGKFLKHKNQHAVFEALQKLKEELMLLGFISLLLTVFQNWISQICIPESITFDMLPCKLPEGSDVGQESHSHGAFSVEHNWRRRRLLSGGSNSGHCKQGKVPLLSLEALHHLHIFIFVLAVVHVIFCATTMVLGGMKIREWKHWEVSIRASIRNGKVEAPAKGVHHMHHHKLFIKEYASGFWRKSFVVSWMMSFLKQFYASVTKTDYIALRSGFINTHCMGNPDLDFHKYMMRVLQSDFRRVVGISWYLWLFVVVFLLLNIDGWHTYFWLSFLPLIVSGVL
ncbi:MLO-like protein 13 [Acorus calamus]|uniref:MLO-like protein 13 n=1 Tax=Acorus calamus TaxID=4465 RepID=A0AAV9E8W2_ACOCL|nr:MLO-like protein 13 [Acorus calamus]